ncbi:MAG: D-alanine--D-alanine ligase [Candidatus Omnitrophica bacterium]|nr:D-alanine--D-alanine ligase [Candidatus Omnitrophota bacterium]
MGLLNKDRIRIAILQGGVSGEREISFLSAQQVYVSCRHLGLDAVPVTIDTRDAKEIERLLIDQGIEFAFIALHGEFGEDGSIQKILDGIGIPYTGSGAAASYLAMDKIASKELFLTHGIPTPDFTIVERKNLSVKVDCYPKVIKPHFGGSSQGIHIVHNIGELKEALADAASFSERVLIEQYIEGTEYTVGILDEQPLGVVQIVPRNGWYDFTAKYADDMTDFIAPAPLEKKLYRQVQEYAQKAHTTLGCRHFSRVDLRLDVQMRPYVLEVNSIPGLTSHSLLPLSARCDNIGFDELMRRMIELALRDTFKIKAGR